MTDAPPLAHEPALLEAVSLNPDDDTPKLVLADYYDEQGQQGKARDMRLWAALRRVVDEPSNDEPRLAYADVCKTYCWHVRAELIEVQCELARMGHELAELKSNFVSPLFPLQRQSQWTWKGRPLSKKRWDRLRTCQEMWFREQELLEADHPPIAGGRSRPSNEFGKSERNPYGVIGVPGYAFDWCDIRRGFVEAVECSAATWLQWADQACRHWEQCGRCHGRGWYERAPGDGEMDCLGCGGRGEVLSPLPRSALPIREVVLTTNPESYVYVARHQRNWRLPPEWGVDVMRSWRAEWPGVTFKLPGE